MLDFLTEALRLNVTRAQMHYIESNLAGEGFMLNVAAVLQRLCAPVDMNTVSRRVLTTTTGSSSSNYSYVSPKKH